MAERLSSLMKYRFTPKRSEMEGSSSSDSTTPVKPKVVRCIPDTPVLFRPAQNSPICFSKPGVLGRRGVVVIDSDEESPVKNSPHKGNLQVNLTPQNGPHYTSPQKQSTVRGSWQTNSNSAQSRYAVSPQKSSGSWNHNSSPFKQQSLSSQSSSPWLSKSFGQQNGHLLGPSRSLSSSPASSWTGSQSSGASSSQGSGTGKYLSRDQLQQGMASLRSMFPSESKETLEQALSTTGDIESAIDIIINKASRVTPQKRPHSAVSSPASSPLPQREFKRIRMLSDSSSDGDSSQGATSLQQKLGVPDEMTFLQKVDHLHSKFPNYTREVLGNILRQYGTRIDKALAALTNYSAQQQKKAIASPTSPTAAHNMGSIKGFSAMRKISKAMGSTSVTVSDDDEEDPLQVSKFKFKGQGPIGASRGFSKFKGKKGQRSGGSKDLVSLGDSFDDEDEDVSDMEDTSDEEEDGTTGEPILDFFNTAQVDELATLNGCSLKKAEKVIGLRPFKDWGELAEKLNEVSKGSLIGACKHLLRDRKAIDQLMATCESFSKRLDEIVKFITRKNEINPESEYTHITKQPECLNKEMELKPFQMVGLNWLMLMHNQELNGILADEMGLGKTIQTISFLSQLYDEGDMGPHVVICPSSTVDNWLRELAKWSPNLSVTCYYGSQEERRDMRMDIMNTEGELDFHVMVTTYNIATGTIEDRNLFKKIKFHYSIFDEGHMLKNMGSLRYKNLLKIRAERRLLLTGTPLQNNLIELMSLLQFIMPQLFWDKQEQLKIFTSVSNKSDDARSKYEQRMIKRAKGIMKPFYLRRLKHQVLKQMPKKVLTVEVVPLAIDQKELYDEMKEKFSKELEEKTKRGGSAMLMELRKAANHHLLIRKKYDDKKLEKMAKLMLREPTHAEANKDYIFEDMQVMNDFELYRLCSQYKSIRHFKLDETEVVDSGKLRHLDELLPVMKEKGDRVLLFSQFTMMLDVLEVYMKQRGYNFLRLDGQTPVVDRQELIDKFNVNEDIFIFLLSTKAGGLGINLTAANVVILHDIDFNPHNDLQAEDRCHRVGQTREVSVYKLLSKGTVEEAMNRCAENKLKLEEDVTGIARGNKKKQEDEETHDVASLLKEALNQEK